jgi:glycerol-3-phosphate O-acyltransferase / dihydroxyacetone phosphate acyltransferase
VRRLIAWLSRFVVRLLFRRIEVAERQRLPRDRPVLLVANHFNGFVDPVVIAAVLGRLPRFVAKAALLSVPLTGFLLRRAGVVFVQRRQDGSTAANADAFVECHDALARGDTVAIFPEGTTHDRPRLDPIRTGAARIALGARGVGVAGIVVVPVGLTYPDKSALRSSALVQFGEPIEVDAVAEHAPDAGATDHEAVEALTVRIEQGLRAVSLDFPDLESALAMEQAAAVALGAPGRPDPSLEARYDLARELGRAPAGTQGAVAAAVGRYTTVLSGLRLTDTDVVSPTRPGRLLRSAIWVAVLVVLLGGVVTATALVNAAPAALVAAVSMFVRTPVTKGTVRVLVGLVAFPAAWITAAVLTAPDVWTGMVVVVLAAFGALAAIWLVERAITLTVMLVRWQAQLERARSVELALEVRADVVAAVSAAVPAAELPGLVAELPPIVVTQPIMEATDAAPVGLPPDEPSPGLPGATRS